jgi:hypothetical protein
MWALEQASWQKNKLLAGFILDKGSCGGNYKHFMQSIKVSKEATYQSQWITLEKAVQTWGKKRIAGKGSVRNNSDEEKSQRSTVS